MGIIRRAGCVWLQQTHNLRRITHRVRTGENLPQIVFLHVPKTGGTTVQRHFSKHVGSCQSGKIARFDSIFSEPEKADIEKARRARYVGGHIDWKAYSRFRTRETFAFTILREPLARLVSTYLYLTNNAPKGVDSSLYGHLGYMPIEDFLRSDDPVIIAWTDNVLVRQFGGSFLDSSVDVTVAEESIANLRSLSYVGFQHRLEEDFQTVTARCGVGTPSTFERANVTPPDSRKTEVLERMNGDLAELVDRRIGLDEVVYKEIIAYRNQADQQSMKAIYGG